MGEIKSENISNNIYIKNRITKKWLNENNFKYNRMLSYNEDNVYTYRFPLCKNGYFITLECELSCIESSGEIRVEKTWSEKDEVEVIKWELKELFIIQLDVMNVKQY